MADRVSAGALMGTKVSVNDLTAMEKETLKKEGRISPEGFVDLAPVAAPELIDIKAEARKKAASLMKSVTEKVPAVPQTLQDHAHSEHLRKEIGDLQAALEKRKSCPRCGLDLAEDYKVEPTPADVEEFLKCVLGGEVFTKKYPLFGGKLVVGFRTRTGDEEGAIKKAISSLFKDLPSISETEVLAEITKYTLAVSLASYDAFGKPCIEYPKLSSTGFAVEANTRLSAIPAQIQAVLKKVLEQFNVLVDMLTSRAQDPNFWTGTAV